jgi:replicative superfamily II helicase
LDAASNLHLLSLIKDIGRIFNALGRISTLQGWNRSADLETLKLRIIHGVGAHLVELISIPGIGGTIANQLYKAGLKTRAAVIRNQNDLGKYITRKANVTRILKGLKELQTQQEVEEL